ncbi:MAG: 23S rRNA (adenine(2030)-N(6))-methyltransferase RlmJ [Alphaproteobacteria bacterium]|nr:23S rRNA (adenine(2030)-N(6))-methyltransferase RlmJ [Alphaproteobacteria bacterium]
MLSYQHSYHAGNLADVHKHMALSIVLEALTVKDKPLSYMETHSGRGLYNFQSEESLKTGEASFGFQALHKAHKIPRDSVYYQAIEKIQKTLGKDFYPGSPMIARLLLRDYDTLNLMELHPEEYRVLHKTMWSFANVHVHKRDGYEGVLAISPPSARRGLVLIDPSYEVKTEYEKAAKFISKLHRKWAEAVIMIWYPILSAGLHKDLKQIITKEVFPKVYISEITFPKPPKAEGMKGSGLILINTPYGIGEQLATLPKMFV